ncbi:hypothetical protein M430DRAFT_202551 [Amorphotheca resinae ATCC 22711]|uniref:Uncharacterized protein n=1 Tax=Amorphotheca resinae ATCC 22711 TaxID=857342 RepID=A0A2T3BAW6_AMORE|nr:hypothetical protein M430DRAFT_202551 [Amorphotheca resinae ATCC 22711]PSS25465.1 hypothetical protein M430DRAFT_202551 [Amorphotheca resinae ATCC 22711]
MKTDRAARCPLWTFMANMVLTSTLSGITVRKARRNQKPDNPLPHLCSVMQATQTSAPHL